jgi:hypothetical protein
VPLFAFRFGTRVRDGYLLLNFYDTLRVAER